MPGAGAAYPKPDDQRINRVPPKFGWVDLPPIGRVGPPPPLPTSRQWIPETLRWWAQLWSKPQATMWVQDGSTLVTLACLYDDLHSGRYVAHTVSAEMRQHEDRHGLNPKAMLQLRWRIADVDAPERSDSTSVADIEARRSRMQVT